MVSASKCNLSVVPAQPIPAKRILPRISQEQLALVDRLRSEIEKLQQVRSQLIQAEGEVKALLEAGADIEPGAFTAEVKPLDSDQVRWTQIADRVLALRAERLSRK